MSEQETPNAEAVPEVTEAAPQDAALGELTARCEQLEREKDELNDRMLRLAAEFDNFRRRSERERLECAEYGSTEALKALLPIVDDFARALGTECADTEYARGIALIEQRLNETLRKLGLEPIVATGQPFDPNLHYAIDRVEDPSIEVDTVASELQRGYLFKGRLLRPAMVRVAVKG
jgi:molecular chaperone GrpE